MNQVKLTRHNGVLKVDIDGALYEPLSFKSFRPTARNISDFHAAGVRLFSILSSGMISMLGVPYSTFGETWLDDNTYDFAPLDAQIELFSKNAPTGYFALMVQLDTRPWYVEKHGVPYSFTHLSQVIGDETWRRLAADYLKAMIAHVEEKYGDRFYGYFMLCGFTTEWFSHFDHEESHPIKEAAYQKYCEDPRARIPSKEMLEQPQNIAFVPEEYRAEVMRYRAFNADLIAESILYFAAEAQSVLKHKKLLGVYFGYLFELNGPRLFECGHLGYEKVFTSPDIDMISSPSSYAFRTVDSTSGFMATYDTLDRHNKLYYLEFDHITHLAPSHVDGIEIPGGNAKLPDHRRTLDVMRRDFMLCLSKGAALWWFDMFEGWFYSDGMMAAVKEMIEISKEINQKPYRSVAEIAVIVSGRSLLGVNKNSGINTELLGNQREGFARMGAPYDVFSACDVDALDSDRYRLFIFSDAFSMDDRTAAFVNRLKEANKTILWLGAPDYLSGGSDALCQTADMQIEAFEHDETEVKTEFGSIRYQMPKPLFAVTDGGAKPIGVYADSGKTAIAEKRIGKRLTVYSAAGNLPGGLLRDIAKKAGVRIYCENDAAPVYVSNLFIGVYANEDAVLLVEDGLYRDRFTGQILEAKNGKLTVPAGDHAAKLLIKVS